jgi:hypothetical protein
VVGNTPCPGIGLANLTVMNGPGGKAVPAPVTPAGPFPGTSANQSGYGCAGFVPGRKITTTGVGVGGAFVMPPKVFSRPFQSYVAAVGVHQPR